MTPQGGVISQLLANIYLHSALDLWFEKGYRKICSGYARLIRYTDDFVVCFQYKKDAVRFCYELVKRLGKFELEVEPTQTKVMEFGKFAVQNAERRGKRVETFDFLGLTHYCSKDRDGKGFRMKRVPVRYNSANQARRNKARYTPASISLFSGHEFTNCLAPRRKETDPRSFICSYYREMLAWYRHSY